MASDTATMRAIAVQKWEEGPKYTSTMAKPTAPSPDSDSVQIEVLASGLHQLVRSQTAHKHYTTTNTPLPYIPGADGVGLTSNGELVYFDSITTGGGFASYINIPTRSIFPIPFPVSASREEKRKVAVYIATLMNPAMSSWMALNTRTTHLPPDFTVLINGVTSISGRIAIKHARYLGAKTVIGIARSAASMSNLDLDLAIPLSAPYDSQSTTSTLTSTLSTHKIDIILDYVYGPSTLAILSALPSNPATAHLNEVQYIDIGTLSDPDMSLPGALLRSKNISMRGSGPGSWSTSKNVKEQYPRLLERMVEGVGEFEITQRRLEDVEVAWKETKARSVFVI